MKTYSLLTTEGTACPETTLCEKHLKIEYMIKVAIPYDVTDKNFTETTGNEECRCVFCN